MSKICSTPGCGGKHLAGGKCRKCYDADPSRIKKRNSWIKKQPKKVRNEIARRAYAKRKMSPEKYKEFLEKMHEYGKKYRQSDKYKAYARKYQKKRWAKMTKKERKEVLKKNYEKMRNDPVRWEKFKQRCREYAAKKRAEAATKKKK